MTKPGLREVDSGLYLDSLKPADRANVEGFLTFAHSLREGLLPVRLAVLAVGSTTTGNPYQADVDLRVLNSGYFTGQRREILTKIEKSIRGQYGKHPDFTDDIYKMPEVSVWRYGDGPIFRFTPEQGLPMHILLSGENDLHLDSYLKEERKGDDSFSVLYYSRLNPPES